MVEVVVPATGMVGTGRTDRAPLAPRTFNNDNRERSSTNFAPAFHGLEKPAVLRCPSGLTDALANFCHGLTNGPVAPAMICWSGLPLVLLSTMASWPIMPALSQG